MRAPAFWWRGTPSLIARLLQPIGALYGAITLRRMRRQGARCGLPVICVGNFVTGGAGKTPSVLALARMLAAMGERPIALSRGYGGKITGPVRVDPARHDAVAVGDEPLLMAHRLPVVVSRDRPAGAALAGETGASLVLMDDGLQNPSLAKDLRIAVVDGASGIGNGLCLPAGPLRAPFDGQIGEIDAVLVIGPGAAGETVAARSLAAGKRVIRARLAVEPALRARLAGLPVLAASGIGRPEKFAATLREAGAAILAEARFGDHHAYGPGDVAALLQQADAHGGCAVAVTEKDMVKLAPLWPAQERDRLLPVPVALTFEDEPAVAALLAETLARRARA